LERSIKGILQPQIGALRTEMQSMTGELAQHAARQLALVQKIANAQREFVTFMTWIAKGDDSILERMEDVIDEIIARILALERKTGGGGGRRGGDKFRFPRLPVSTTPDGSQSNRPAEVAEGRQVTIPAG
jgi:hypothetical protein